ncbi:MAG: ribosome biogenesis GTP-binding protein YihA/YsxC [Luteibaculaceae bacterium]
MIKQIQAEFVMSNSDYKKCPAPTLPEYAFIGRSNVGKSSLINMLTNQRGLAKTSGSPGKTQLINHFRIDNTWYLVDLPGYGYAKISKSDRAKFLKMIYSYLENRENLVCVFQLVDSRHAPQEKDLKFMQWLGEKEVPFVIVFTKTDKLSSVQLKHNIEDYKTELKKTWETLPEMFYTSSSRSTGKEEILAFVDKVNQNFKK